MKKDRLSIFISLILRHKPEVIGISLDQYGWAWVEDLIKGINERSEYTIDINRLQEIVRMDAKQRYTFNDDATKIRANQGHSIKVDVELQSMQPPEILFHGTGKKYVESILESGLISKSRLYVHLSKDIETAIVVGKRHGSPVIFEVDAGKMHREGITFYQSKNAVWLTKEVPVRYLKKMDGNEKSY
ncbi:RNA 2'-phosphotransferase [Lachnospiraceae bacterium OttesenSCG-928-D06]|nr:RNA 2'-phosphotransferase [Lachnospiraceae bacterium OttesenSCG-928-D06]